MSKIVFITSGKIDYILPGKDLYESISITASGKIFPSLNKEGKLETTRRAEELMELNASIIYSAPSAQCLETAEILSKKLTLPLEQDDRLLPLKFDLKSMFTEEQFESLGERKFEVLRTGYIKNFFNNKLIDSNREIEKRYKNFILGEILANHKNETVLIISHAYLIKLFYIYNQLNENMYENKEKLFKLFNPAKETMNRLEMLSLEL